MNNALVALGQRPLEVREAYEALEAYAAAYGQKPLLLMMHASVPETLRADLLNLIKLNFLQDYGTDLSIEADVLFSPLTTDLGGGYYRIDPQVRWHCQSLLNSLYRKEARSRQHRIAELLWCYVESMEHKAVRKANPLFSEFLEVQRWLAFAILDPEAATRAFAQVLKTIENEQKPSVFLRFGGLTSAIEIPLAHEQELIAYLRGLNALTSGDEQRGREIFESFEKDEILIGGEVLRVPTEILREKLDTAENRDSSNQDDQPESNKPKGDFGPEKMPKGAIYLSYAGEDLSSVLLICDALEQAGIDVWFEKNDLHDNDSLSRIRTNIDHCSLFLPILSHNSVARRESFLRVEWEYAQERALRFSANSRFVIPIAIDDILPDEPSVREFSKYHWARLSVSQINSEFLHDIKVLFDAYQRNISAENFRDNSHTKDPISSDESISDSSVTGKDYAASTFNPDSQFIYISYVRADDQRPPDDKTKGWVTFFCDQLRFELTSRGAKQAKLWLDRYQIEPMENFTTEVVEALEQARFMLIIISNNWLQRDWCQQELERFCQIHKDAEDRLILIYKDKVDRELLPSFVQAYEGYQFYKVTTSDQIEEFYWRGLKNKNAYHNLIKKIAENIIYKLETAQQSEVPPTSETTLRRTVFVALTASDLRDARQRLVLDFKQAGIQVLPDDTTEHILETADELEQLVNNALSRAELTIHLLGDRRGITLEGCTEPIVDYQIRRARETTLPRIFWIPNREKFDSFMGRIGTLAANEKIYGVSILTLSRMVRKRLMPAP